MFCYHYLCWESQGIQRTYKVPPCVLTASLLPGLQLWPQGSHWDILSRAFWSCWAWWLKQIRSVNKLWPVCNVCWCAGGQRNDPLIPDSLNLRFSEKSGIDSWAVSSWEGWTHSRASITPLWYKQVLVSKLHVNSAILHFCASVTSGNSFYWR